MDFRNSKSIGSELHSDYLEEIVLWESHYGIFLIFFYLHSASILNN